MNKHKPPQDYGEPGWLSIGFIVLALATIITYAVLTR